MAGASGPLRKKPPHIAIAIGNAAHRAQITAALTSFYSFVQYSDIPGALSGLRARPPSVALVGDDLPPTGGFDFVRQLRHVPEFAKVPVVLVVGSQDRDTLESIRQCGADDYLVKPYLRSQLIRLVSSLLNRDIERGWKALPPLQSRALTKTVEIFNSVSDVIDRGEPIPYASVSTACTPLVEAVNKQNFKGILGGVRDYDNYSYAHSLRVATLLTLFGFTIRLSPSEQTTLTSGGLLHDVGKMTIPHEVLNKPGRLTADEFFLMKGHVGASVAYLQKCSDLPRGIITIAEQHHEKLDGSGYPYGLANGKLNELARMASIVDVFSALTDRRVYKPAFEAEKALAIMTDEMSTQLDQRFLSLFREMLLDTV